MGGFPRDWPDFHWSLWYNGGYTLGHDAPFAGSSDWYGRRWYAAFCWLHLQSLGLHAGKGKFAHNPEEQFYSWKDFKRPISVLANNRHHGRPAWIADGVFALRRSHSRYWVSVVTQPKIIKASAPMIIIADTFESPSRLRFAAGVQQKGNPEYCILRCDSDRFSRPSIFWWSPRSHCLG